MTHLKIEQNNGTRETVASSVIKKLYDLAKEIELDVNGTIALKGWLYTSATYQDYITYLQNISKINGEPQLIIDAGKAYITFADPEIQSGLATEYGDGTGVTLTNMSGITRLKDALFNYNTSVQSFNELGQFSNITTIGSDTFHGCSNLTSIDLSKIEYIGRYAFYEANLTGAINLPSFKNFTDPTNYYGWRCAAFCKNRNITSVTFGENYTGILEQGYVFDGCSSLVSISGLKTNPDNHIMPLGMFAGCTSLTSIGDIDLSHYTKFYSDCFADCRSLTINFDPTVITYLGESAFRGLNIGANQTLELNLTDQTNYPHNALGSTKYSRLILHSPQQTSTYDSRYPIYGYMTQLTYLDLSDWKVAKLHEYQTTEYSDCSFYGMDSLVTYIAPATTTYIGNCITAGKNYSSFRYMILLTNNPPGIQTTNNYWDITHWFDNNNIHIYVPNAAAKAAYLADPDWATIGSNGSAGDKLADRLHDLTELPAGVWTTGLASQYLTPAQLATS